jgi:hypothetical protein
MDVTKVLEEALEAVNKAKLPEELRVVGFKSAVGILTGGPQAYQLGNSAGHQVASKADSVGAGDSSADVQFNKIADALKISTVDAERLFDDYEGQLQFIGNVSYLGKSKATKVASLALIYIVARQAAKYDDGSTPDATVRTEIERHGLLDVGNYTKHITPLKADLNINGSGKNATYKVKYEGREHAKEIAASLLKD